MEWLLIGAVFYMLPWFWAMSRKHKNSSAIGVLNLLLGWTLLGWVAALVWASTSNTRHDEERRDRIRVRDYDRR